MGFLSSSLPQHVLPDRKHNQGLDVKEPEFDSETESSFKSALKYKWLQWIFYSQIPFINYFLVNIISVVKV